MESTDHKYRGEKGQSLIELAFSILFLFILIAGVVDLGRAFFTYIALRDAAQEGAVYASVARKDLDDSVKCSEIKNRAQSTSDTQIVDLDDTSVSVSFDNDPCDHVDDLDNKCYSEVDVKKPCNGQSVEVKVTYGKFPLTTPFLGTIIGSQTITITASILDTVITPLCVCP